MSTEQESQPSEEQHGFDRRNFLRLGLAGAAAVAATATGVTITKRPRGELAGPLAELAAVAPGPWSELLQRAVVRLANEDPPQAGG